MQGKKRMREKLYRWWIKKTIYWTYISI